MGQVRHRLTALLLALAVNLGAVLLLAGCWIFATWVALALGRWICNW